MRASYPLLWIGLWLGALAWARQGDTPVLKLVASIDTAGPEQQPVLVVKMENLSPHTLRIPDPPLLCDPAPGALSVKVKFTPKDDKPAPPAADCGLEIDGSGLPDIRERARNWLSIPAGGAYEARRPLAMALDASARGTYEIRAIYNGPAANSGDEEKLKQAGVDAPQGRFQSAKIVYKSETPHR